MKVRNLISPIIYAAAKLFPYNTQRKVIEACSAAIKMRGGDLSIKFRGYDVYLLARDNGGAEIYLWYLLRGTWTHERYEQWVVEKLLLEIGSCEFIDVGASYGLYSLLASSIPNVSNVIAVEASLATFGCLTRTIQKNGLSKRVHLINGAVSSVSGVDFRVIELKNSEWNKVQPANEEIPGTVKSISIDDIVRRFSASSKAAVFVKMDIEGGEPEAFDGMRELLSGRENYIIMFEFHVGLLDLNNGGAAAFGQRVLDVHNALLYQIDVRNHRLRRLLSLNDLEVLINFGKTAGFPGNVFNFLLVSESLGKYALKLESEDSFAGATCSVD